MYRFSVLVHKRLLSLEECTRNSIFLGVKNKPVKERPTRNWQKLNVTQICLSSFVSWSEWEVAGVCRPTFSRKLTFDSIITNTLTLDVHCNPRGDTSPKTSNAGQIKGPQIEFALHSLYDYPGIVTGTNFSSNLACNEFLTAHTTIKPSETASAFCHEINGWW